ncbi:MAG TPA: 4Fe-4S dicluster domain-containing protein [Burkholderiales bacterium]
MQRRDFLRSSLAAVIPVQNARAEAPKENKEFVGVLVDTTRCIGCRSCEVACAEANGKANGLVVPDVKADNALERRRDTTDKQWTIVNRFKTEKGDVFVKRQCMHCWQPACVSACLVNAMYKTREGPVTWNGDKCLGCRFCMVGCPFDIPKAEYLEWNPRIQKCNMCYARLQQGGKPACVEACPTDTLMFGPKRQLMEIARHRVYSHPDKYVHQIYGENEVGGTGWLYLSAVPFDQIGFRTDLGTTPYPEYTKQFLVSVPMILFGVPAFLLGLNQLADRKNEARESAQAEEAEAAK